MKIVKILGGLGNQMFQYAFYKSLKHKHNVVKADLSDFKYYSLHNKYELNKIFKIDVSNSAYLDNLILSGQNRDMVSRVLKKLLNRRKPGTYYLQENPTCFDGSVYFDPANCYLDGYWQNYRYFSAIQAEIHNDFQFPAFEDINNLNLLAKIKTTNSVSIHVRRGDYVGHALLGDICDLGYYTRAIDFFNRKYPELCYYVFSNDIEWCRENLIFSNEASFIDCNNDANSYKDMQLMSNCNHNIVANSSFSWWAAWLNPNPFKEVIAPELWFNTPHNIRDIVPAEWIII